MDWFTWSGGGERRADSMVEKCNECISAEKYEYSVFVCGAVRDFVFALR